MQICAILLRGNGRIKMWNPSFHNVDDRVDHRVSYLEPHNILKHHFGNLYAAFIVSWTESEHLSWYSTPVSY